MPGLLKDRKRLTRLAASKAVFHLLSQEAAKEERKERQRLVRIRLHY